MIPTSSEASGDRKRLSEDGHEEPHTKRSRGKVYFVHCLKIYAIFELCIPITSCIQHNQGDLMIKKNIHLFEYYSPL